jgi:PIN domain nuclease of toxin-antitoxin system
MTVPVLLDTCAVIFLGTGKKLAAKALEAVENALEGERAHISVASAWEIGRSMSLGRIASTLTPMAFYSRFASQEGVSECALSPEIVIASSYLPAGAPNDPMDRIMIATARELDLSIVTSDHKIIAYAAAGHVKAIAC